MASGSSCCLEVGWSNPLALGLSILYFYRNRSRFTDWQAVVLCPTRSLEQADCYRRCLYIRREAR